jgi:AcrR family transcriptional regulator
MPDNQPRTTRDARSRILETAGRLFYAEGVRAIGVDRVIAESGVARMTLYNQFGSKSGLVAAWLERRDAEWMGWLEQRVQALGGDVAAVFDALGEWFDSDTFRGCAFINTHAELGDSDDAAAAHIRAHKEALRAFLQRVAREDGAADPTRFSHDLLLIVEGAIVTASIGTLPAAADIAKHAALRLLASAP